MSHRFDVVHIGDGRRTRPNAAELRERCERCESGIGFLAFITRPDDIAAVEGWVARLGEADAVAHIEPLTDALQRVDRAGVVLDAVNRASYGRLGFPQLVRIQALELALDGVVAEVEIDPTGAVLAGGGLVLAAPHPRRRPL